jgi:hypothetical protein
MSWFKISDGFAFHRKALAAGNDACGAWMRAGAWCGAAENLTDGYVPPEVAKQIAKPRVWAKLREVGLTEAPSDGRPGEQIHDYLTYNPSGEKVRAERAAWAERQRRSRGGVSHAVTSPVTAPVSEPRPVPVPVPVPKDPDHTHTGAAEVDGEDELELGAVDVDPVALPEPVHAVDPGEDPNVEAILAAFRAHRVITEASRKAPAGAPAAARAMADEIYGRMLTSGKPLAWILEAIADAAGALAAEASGLGCPLDWTVVATKLGKYAAHARAPRPEAAPAPGKTGGKVLTPAGAEVLAEYRASRRLHGAALHDIAPTGLDIHAANFVATEAQNLADQEQRRDERSPWTAQAIAIEWVDHHCGPRAPDHVIRGEHALKAMTDQIGGYPLKGQRPGRSAVERLAAKMAPKAASTAAQEGGAPLEADLAASRSSARAALAAVGTGPGVASGGATPMRRNAS